MKKKILVPALMALSLFGFNAMAQSNGSCPAGSQQCEQTTCGKQGKCAKGEQPGQCKKGKKGGKKDFFAGINLTEAQQTKLQELKAKKAEAFKKKAGELKAEKQKNDSARMAERKASQREYLQEVKSIIGPDNYVVFLENMVVEGGGRQAKAARFKGAVKSAREQASGQRQGKGKGHDRKGHHADNGAKRQSKAPQTANS